MSVYFKMQNNLVKLQQMEKVKITDTNILKDTGIEYEIRNFLGRNFETNGNLNFTLAHEFLFYYGHGISPRYMKGNK